MFDELRRALYRLQKTHQVTINMPLDADGYIDRICPGSNCHATFKVLWTDWREKVLAKVVYCPICRHDAPATQWNTSAQKRYIKEVGVREIKKRIDGAIADAVRRSRPTKTGMFTMSLSYKPGAPALVLPLCASRLLEMRAVCESCGCAYASIGAAFFCPACGHNSAASTFDAAVSAVRATMDSIGEIAGTVADSGGTDLARDVTRTLCESCLERLVAAFQRFAEAAFQKLPCATTMSIRRNAFQSIDEGDLLWRQAVGKGYSDLMTAPELNALRLRFQQRHLIAHREGIVDQAYIDKARDQSWDVGQRLVLRPHDVLHLAQLVESLSRSLRALIPS
jgi:uncharacterized Zn finger protein (UPF0148 family)